MSIMGLILGGLIVLMLLSWVVRLFAGMGSISRGHANLNCPHCGKETPANIATCEHCGSELR